MNDSCTDGALSVALAARDPETLVGPMLWMLTRLARGTDDDAAACADLRRALAAHLAALAGHPDVARELRLVAGALAIEHRQRTTG